LHRKGSPCHTSPLCGGTATACLIGLGINTSALEAIVFALVVCSLGSAAGDAHTTVTGLDAQTVVVEVDAGAVDCSGWSALARLLSLQTSATRAGLPTTSVKRCIACWYDISPALYPRAISATSLAKSAFPCELNCVAKDASSSVILTGLRGAEAGTGAPQASVAERKDLFA